MLICCPVQLQKPFLLLQAEQKKWAAREASLRDASQGIEGFESNLRRLGLDADAEADADPIVPIEGNSPHETLRKILGKLPPTGTVEQARALEALFFSVWFSG